MRPFRMPKWFIARANEAELDTKQNMEIPKGHTTPQEIHRPVVEEPKRKPRRLAPRKLLLVRRKDVVKFYMVGRRLQVLCMNAEYHAAAVQSDAEWFAIGMVVEHPGAEKLMIYDGPVFSMSGMDIEEKFSELRKQFPGYIFNRHHMTLERKEE